MIWLKRDPLLTGLIFAAILSTGGEGWWLWRIRAEAVRAMAVLEQKNQEREGLKAQSPAPTEENELAVDRELALARTRLSEMENTWVGVGGGVARAVSVAKPIDGYFEIASFVEKTRALAAQSQVSIRPDEHFGFASHTSEGPTVDGLPDVLRQRAATQVLLETLMAAQPVALVSIQREHPPAPATRERQGDPTDFFEMTPALSLRKSGVLEADAFKVEFTGQTRGLREFLNRLFVADPTFVVRTVEAETANPTAIKPDSSAKSGAPIPIVVEGWSRFRVVIERLRPVLETEGEAR